MLKNWSKRSQNNPQTRITPSPKINFSTRQTEYVRTIETLYENGDISRFTYQNRKRAAGRLTEFHDTGRLEWSVPIKASRFVLNEYYEKILADLVPNEEIGSKAKRDLTWVGRKYFAWLMEEGHSDLSCVGADEVQGFMIYCSRHMASSGVHNIKLYMKKLYRYLSSHGYGNADYNGLLSFPVSRESKLYPAASHKEINQTLDMIDRRTPQGKGCRIYGRSKGYYVVFIGS